MPALFTPLPTPPASPRTPVATPPPWSPLPALAPFSPANIQRPTIPPCPAVAEIIAAPTTARMFSPLPTVLCPPAPKRAFTDSDLRDAISPLLDEPIRAAVRRAAAPARVSRPSWLTRARYHLRALFSNRSYQEILTEKSNHYQIDEVFLIDATTSALVSFASQNAARHGSQPTMESAAGHLISRLRNDAGGVRRAFRMSDDQSVITCVGDFVILMATINGRPGKTVRADLEFALRGIEEEFREPFRHPDAPLHAQLQPILADCLRIPAPPPPVDDQR